MSETILVVDDETALRDSLRELLEEEGYAVTVAADGEEALRHAAERGYDLVLLDMVMPGADGVEVMGRLKTVLPGAPVFIMTAFGSIESAVEAVKLGAAEYIVKPFDFSELLLKARRLFRERELMRVNQSLRETLRRSGMYSHMVGASPAMREVFALIERIGPTASTALITGESGVGKELVARAIHEKSPRRDQPYLPVNCAAIPPTLLESELFGHYKGSFTGAEARHEGYFRLAEGGTLFLDEIGSMPVELQGKLLRAIEQREIIPLGGRGVERVNVRILAAANRNLKEEAAAGRFREDLYYRLSMFEIAIAPLRDRREDIPPLVDWFVAQFNADFGKNVRGAAKEVIAAFLACDWRGNVRELKNIIERAMIMCDGEWINEQHLPAGFGQLCSQSPSPQFLRQALDRYERTLIADTLRSTENDKKRAAEILGVSLPSLYRKVRELGIEGGAGE
ncbi:MAG: sigma-54-dependent Fis family transcriptional regulator [Nitrospinae bacterium]|nr:sigma-54-dependent Fis family transcriptional regulator [Nitrospinota bacterium]